MIYNGCDWKILNVILYTTYWQARKKIENILQRVIEEKRRALEKQEREVESQMDKLIMARDENGMKLYDNNAIIDLLLGLLHAGHHTPSYVAMWALVHISQKPHIFLKAKVCSFFPKTTFNSFYNRFDLHFIGRARVDSTTKTIYSKGINFSRNQANEISYKGMSFFFFFYLTCILKSS